MNKKKFFSLLKKCHNAIDLWEKRLPNFKMDDTLKVPEYKIDLIFEKYFKRIENHYPFFHPQYIGQMLKPPHPVASLAYFTAMLINPNNHALDGGPETSELEKESVEQLAKMFGFKKYLGHLTSSGTIANLEGLWISKSMHPKKFIAFSKEAHYTHKRMCSIIGTNFIEINTDNKGKLDINDLERKLRNYPIGTIVATIGTTGRGAIDPIHKLLELKKKFNFRIHVDAAYGGYFTLLAKHPEGLIESEPFLSISKCDSVVIDPHKHGLQPYGCGSIIFKDPSVGKFYKHDSPYTYFTSKELHLGEISLECSRAGASAAALWVTLQLFPLKQNEGMGQILTKTRMTALRWAELINRSDYFSLLSQPELDIIVFFPKSKPFKSSLISELSEKIFTSAMNNKNFPIYLAKMKLESKILRKNFPELIIDKEHTTLIRCCLMKPEHLNYIPKLHKQIENIAKKLLSQ
jgi:glutamate/tyrosine decarboxylase-like PLP-dependent enzyme